MSAFELRQIGTVRSDLRERAAAPRQGSEGAPDAWLEIEPDLADCLDGLRVGDEIIVITWLHLGDRTRLKVYPRGDRTRLAGGSRRGHPIGRTRSVCIA